MRLCPSTYQSPFNTTTLLLERLFPSHFNLQMHLSVGISAGAQMGRNGWNSCQIILRSVTAITPHFGTTIVHFKILSGVRRMIMKCSKYLF